MRLRSVRTVVVSLALSVATILTALPASAAPSPDSRAAPGPAKAVSVAGASAPGGRAAAECADSSTVVLGIQLGVVAGCATTGTADASSSAGHHSGVRGGHGPPGLDQVA